MVRVGVIGARRQSQGIGEHVVRHLTGLGAEVCAIAGTRPETVEAAQANLLDRHGIQTRGYADISEMLKSESLDAVAICSPDAFHREHLSLALEHRLHVLCEKPLVFEPGRDPVADARPLVEGFAAAGKVLMVNEQWPFTLPAFQDLHPEAMPFERPLKRLSMLLCPSGIGAGMIPAALPHLLSMLLTLAPGAGAASDIRVQPLDGSMETTSGVRVEFNYVRSCGTTEVSAVFRQVPEQPRPAAYAINGYAASRIIEMPSYQMYLEASDEAQWLNDQSGKSFEHARGKTKVLLPDPLVLLLKEFLRRIENARRPEEAGPMILDSLKILSAVYQSALEVAGAEARPMLSSALASARG